MKNRRKFGRRKSDYFVRYLLITSIIAHIVVAVSWIAGCSTGVGMDIGTAGGVIGGGSIGGGSPAGSGNVIVSVSFGKTVAASSARTALPALAQNGFDKVKLSFASNEQAAPAAVEFTGSTKTVTLAEGAWTIRAGGIIGGTEVAYGTADVTVGAGAQSIPVSIAATIPSAGANGTWKYSVEYPSSDIQSIGVKVTKVGEVAAAWEQDLKAETGGNSLATEDSKTTAAGSHPLAPGYYIVTVTATRSGKSISRLDAAHVYTGIETTSTFAITDADFLTTITGVAITASGGGAAPTQIARAGDAQFKATVTGTNIPDSNILWSIVPDTTGIEITAPGNGPQTTANGTVVTVHATTAAVMGNTFTVRAVSAQDAAKYDEVTVTIALGTGTAGAGITTAAQVQAAIALASDHPGPQGTTISADKGETVSVWVNLDFDTYSWNLNDPLAGRGKTIAIDTAALDTG
jgi:hypothetical protein